jgi:hypothetical protein
VVCSWGDKSVFGFDVLLGPPQTNACFPVLNGLLKPLAKVKSEFNVPRRQKLGGGLFVGSLAFHGCSFVDFLGGVSVCGVFMSVQ